MTKLSSIYAPPTKASTDEVWIKWYDEISGFGKKKADIAFTRAWAVRGSDKANTSNLRDYMAGKGINIPANSLLASVGDTARSFGSGVTDFFKMGAIGTSAIMAVIVIVVLIIVYKNLSNPDNTARIISAAR